VIKMACQELKSKLRISALPASYGTRPDRLSGMILRKQLDPMRLQPRLAASIAAMSIFCMVIIASNARLAAAVSLLVVASMRARGVICQDKPHWSVHQPHWLAAPPL